MAKKEETPFGDEWQAIKEKMGAMDGCPYCDPKCPYCGKPFDFGYRYRPYRQWYPDSYPGYPWTTITWQETATGLNSGQAHWTKLPDCDSGEPVNLPNLGLFY